VTLCDPIWHVSSSSGVATSVSELLYPCYLQTSAGVGMCRALAPESWLRWATLSVKDSVRTAKAEWSPFRYSFCLKVLFLRQSEIICNNNNNTAFI